MSFVFSVIVTNNNNTYILYSTYSYLSAVSGTKSTYLPKVFLGFWIIPMTKCNTCKFFIFSTTICRVGFATIRSFSKNTAEGK